MKYAIILTLLAVLALSACTASETDSNDEAPDGAAGTVPEGSENAGDFDDTPGPVVIDMLGGNYYFEVDGERNPTITVQQGDVVRITLESVEGLHDVLIDELDVVSARVSEGGVTQVEFIASQTGEFDYYCSVGNHRERGMVGTLVVQ